MTNLVTRELTVLALVTVTGCEEIDGADAARHATGEFLLRLLHDPLFPYSVELIIARKNESYILNLISPKTTDGSADNL